jgi:tetratricopeptide (TPR) repeat protein
MKLTKRDFLLLAVVVYFTVIGGTFYSQLNFGLRVTNQLIVTLILGGWLTLKLRRGEGLPRTPLDPAVALFLVVSFLSAMLGQSPRYSLEVLWLTLAHTLAFYLLVDLFRRGWLPRLAWAVYMASAVVCLITIAEMAAWYFGSPLLPQFSQGWWDIGGWQHPLPPLLYRPNMLLNGSTHLAAYLSLLIPPAMALVLTLPRYHQNRKALLLWLGLAFIVEVFTLSRVGVLGLGVSLSLLALGWLWLTRPHPAAWLAGWRRLSFAARLGLIIAAVALLSISAVWLPQSFRGRQVSTDFRFTLWRTAAAILVDSPLTGAGPGNFPRALLRLNNPALPRFQIGSAHSIYFNTAAELGLAGLLTGAAVYLLLAWSWRQHWRQLTDTPAKIRLIAVGATLAGLAAQLLVDTYAATPHMLVVGGLMAGLVRPLTHPRPFRRVPAALGLAALTVYLLGLGWIALADVHFQSSLRQEQTGNLPAAISEAEAAAQIDPSLWLYEFRLGLLNARLANGQTDPATRQAAIAPYQTGLAHEPILGLNSANLAAMLWQDGRQTEAIALLAQTLAAEPDPRYALNLGYFYEQQDDWAQAAPVYGRLLSRHPELAASLFWSAAERQAHWPAIEAAALAALPPTDPLAGPRLSAKLALAQGDGPRFGTIIAPLTAELPPGPELFEYYLARFQFDKAETQLPHPPQSATDYLNWGRLKWFAGDDAAAEAFFKRAAFAGDREGHTYLGQLYEQQGKLDAAKAAYQKGWLVAVFENIEVSIYGRYGANDLAPQLIRLADERTFAPVLALARLANAEGHPEEADRLYNLLAEQDYFFVKPPEPRP